MRSARGPLVLTFVTGVACGLAGHAALRPGDDDLRLFRAVRDRALAVHVEDHAPRELLDDALAGMVGGLDRYSRYYPPSRAEALDRETSGEYLGIGILFHDRDRAVIRFALPGSPAQEAGLRPGDRLVRIDDERVADLPPGGVREALGRDAPVELELESRHGERRVVRLRPDRVLDPSVRHERMLDAVTGYLAVTSFTRRTAAEVDRAVAWLRERGMQGLVLDLRANPGGTLDAALRLADRFVAEGVLVSTRSRFETRSTRARSAETALAGLPTVVLVDADTASASEVLCGALQDHRAAVVVGAPTYGKGAVQTLFDDFADPDVRVKITTSHYFTPAGRRIERDERRGGLAPDVHVESSALERRSVHAFLASYSPPPQALDELAAWEEEQGVEVLPRPPDDAQLEVAHALLRGEAPGPLTDGDGG